MQIEQQGSKKTYGILLYTILYCIRDRRVTCRHGWKDSAASLGLQVECLRFKEKCRPLTVAPPNDQAKAQDTSR